MKNLIILIVFALLLVGMQLVFGSEILIPISAAFFLISSGVGIWLSLQQYRLKLSSEKIESDIKLMTLFTKLMNTAHGRSGYVVSEKTIEQLFKEGIISKEDAQDIESLNQKIKDAAILNLPVGTAEQDAAIAAIAKLGERHEVLKGIAIEALTSLSKFKSETANKYLNKLAPTEMGKWDALKTP